MPDISLISPPGRANSMYLPIGLISLAAFLRNRGLSVNIIDIKTDPYSHIAAHQEESVIKKILLSLKQDLPKFVGLTGFTADYRVNMALAKLIKEKFSIKIILGGVHATLSPEDFIFPDSPIDIICIGEGENTLYELITRSWSTAELMQIKGIAFLYKDRFFTTSQRALIDSLDFIPMPDYQLLNMDYYTQMNKGVIRFLLVRGVHIFTSRGCPFPCTFCANKELWKDDKGRLSTRSRSIPQIIEELEFLKRKYHIDAFYIADDTFALQENRAIEFGERLLASRADYIWAMETRVNLISDKLVKALRRAGCIQMEFGVESGSQAVLDRIKKRITVEDTIRAFQICKNNKIRTFANIMFNTPCETEDDVKQTFKLIRLIKPDKLGFNLTIPFPGTEIYDSYVEPKLSPAEYVVYEHPRLFCEIHESRFRMASHNLDLAALHFKANLQNYLNPFFDFIFDRNYLTKILCGKRKKEFIKVIWGNILRQSRSYVRFIRGRL